MIGLHTRLTEDRKLRDAALDVFITDLRFIREDLHARGVGERIADRIGSSALEVIDEAVDYAEANTGRIAAALAAVVLWFARTPLLNGLARIFGFDDDEEQDDGDSRSDDD
ncbi:MAG TPA: hypothetical protein VIC34_08620 [Croceibacterium sp.]